VFWASFLSTAIAFNGTFAVRLGGSNFLIGLLSSLPSLLVVIALLPSGELFIDLSKRLKRIVRLLFSHRLIYLLVALLPFVFSHHRAPIFVGLILFSQIPLALFNLGFQTLFGDLLEEDKWANVSAWRNIIVSLTTSAGAFLSSILLTRILFPLNFQLLYMFGFLGGLTNLILISKLRIPSLQENTTNRSNLFSISTITDMPAMLFTNRPFARLVSGTLVHNFGSGIAGPLYLIYYLRELQATDAWMGMFNGLSRFGMIFGYFIWQMLSARYGARRFLWFTCLLTATFPILVGISKSLSLILFFTWLNGLIGPGYHLSHSSTMYLVSSSEKRSTYLALFTLVSSLSSIIAPLVGVAISEIIGLNKTILIGAGILLLSGILFWRMPAALENQPQESIPSA